MKLKQVIASILTDLTQAQSIADNYSRRIKAAYKNDPALRLLPVPKAGIKEIKLDLKVAFLPTSRVTIYEHPDYKGKSQDLTEGNYDRKNLTIGNAVIGGNSLSSLKIPEGMKVTLYDREGFQGQSKSFTEDVPNMTTYGFDNKTSSIKVEQISAANSGGLHVEILTDKLQQIPESSLSSISITLDLDSI